MSNKKLYQSYLHKLELEHANKGELEDIAHSNTISSDQALLGQEYFLSFKLIGCIFSISLATTASYWGFSPPAAILTYINQDIGITSGAFSTYMSQAQRTTQVCF